MIVTAFDANGNVIAPGTPLKNPIQLGSNASCNISFVTASSGTETSATLKTAVGSIPVQYSIACAPPSQIVITAFDLDATPQSVTLSVLGGTSTVATMTLSMIVNPGTGTIGVYPLFVTAKDSTGAVIPYGQSLTFPIQLSSNAANCLTFGTSPSGAFSNFFNLTDSVSQVYILFDPNISVTCRAPTYGTVTIQAIATGATSASYQFPF